MTVEIKNAIYLTNFRNTVYDLKARMKREYDRSVNLDLSQQRYQDVFRRNVAKVLRATYQQALTRLQQLLQENEDQANEQTAERNQELSSTLLQSFDGVIEELIVYAFQKHRGSCALSNFPDEHNPSEAYLAEVIEEASRDWTAFSAQVNKLVSD